MGLYAPNNTIESLNPEMRIFKNTEEYYWNRFCNSVDNISKK